MSSSLMIRPAVSQSTSVVNSPAGASMIAADTDDAGVIEMWLHGRSPHTQRAYTSDVDAFRAFSANKPLARVTLQDLQAFSDSLKGAPASRSRRLGAIKSLLSFGHRIGYLPFDAGRVLRLPPAKNKLAERILTEAQAHRLIELEPNPRNHAMLRLLYASAMRVSEIAGLKWRDLQDRENGGGQISAYGKGGKTRFIRVRASVWEELEVFRGEPDSPVFPSRKGGGHGHLRTNQVLRIVQAAARRAGIKLKVSPHWLRHSHASHALDRGAPIHLVQATLGHASVATTGRYLHARPGESSERFLAL